LVWEGGVGGNWSIGGGTGRVPRAKELLMHNQAGSDKSSTSLRVVKKKKQNKTKQKTTTTTTTKNKNKNKNVVFI
jgi:hypothetical protein